MSLSDSIQKADAQLSQLDGDSSELGRMKRIALADALADSYYHLEKVARNQNQHGEADKLRSQADSYWGMVVKEVG